MHLPKNHTGHATSGSRRSRRAAPTVTAALVTALTVQAASAALPQATSHLASQIDHGTIHLDPGIFLPAPKQLDLSTYAIEIEAEAFVLESYVVEPVGHASNGNLIRLPADQAAGTATTTFDQASDDYYVVVYYLDENDGAASLSVEIDGDTVQTWTLDQDFGADITQPTAFTARRFGPVRIERGDDIALIGNRDAAENARVDMIQLIPSDDLYQAEDAAMSGGAAVRSSEPGFVGGGYVRLGTEFTAGSITLRTASVQQSGLIAKVRTTRPAFDAVASDLVYQLGPKSIEWTVNAAKRREYALEFRYAFGAAETATRPLDVFVNGDLVKAELPFNGTGLANRWRTQIMLATLNEGANTVRVETTGSGGADIDYLAATPINYINAMGDVTPLSDPYFPEYGDPGYYDTYYGKVDPQGKRETLAEWLDENDFNDFPHLVKSAEYINANDLGFGREMHCIDNGRSSCYVENSLDPKGASVFAATVTMERMSGNYGNFVAYFVYDANGDRINQIALDSEGPKSVPESCYACHGGSRHGSAFMGGNYLPFDIEALEDWPGHPTRAQQLEDFRELNDIVWNDSDLHGNDNLVDLIEGWYDGVPGFGSVYDTGSLPGAGWHGSTAHIAGSPTAAEAEAIDEFLYDDVYGKYCRLCHVAQDLDWQTAEAGDFARAAYAHICNVDNNDPRMPHAEVTFNKFNFDRLYTASDAEPGSFTIGNSYTLQSRLQGVQLARDARLVAELTNVAGFEPGDFVLAGFKKTAREMLCDVLPLSFPEGDPLAGETKYGSTCAGCHRVEDAATIADYSRPDLRCRGAWLRQEMGTVDSQMNGIHLSMGEMADLSEYFNSFDTCD